MTQAEQWASDNRTNVGNPYTDAPATPANGKLIKKQPGSEIAKDDTAEKERRARLVADTTVQEAGPVDTSFAQGAGQNMAAYDAYTRAGMGATPQETMALADAAARNTAQSESDQAIRAAVKGARTGGALPGAAALAGTAQAASAYGAGMNRGTQQYFDTTKFGATLASDMSGRLQNASQLKAQQDAANLAARTASMQAKTGAESAYQGNRLNLEASKYAADQAAKSADKQRKTGLLGGIIGAAGGVLGALSDENLKKDIKPESMTDGLEKVKPYSYKYKGSDEPQGGVMAQDLEKTNMKPAVVDTEAGKAVNTGRLSLMNTGAIAEQEKRLKDIERLLKGLGEMGMKKAAGK